MRTSHTEIRKKISDAKNKYTDEQVFATPGFQGYLNDLAESVSKRYKRPLKVKTVWDPSPGSQIAWTDNNAILINTGNEISLSFPTRAMKADSIIGFLGHELGHILFTNFVMMNACNSTFRQGRFYPSIPQNLSPDDQAALDEILVRLDEKDDAVIFTVMEAVHHIFNITEDAYIESRMCDAFEGKIKTGVRLNQVRQVELIPSLTKQIDSGLDGYAIMQNLFLSYVRSGEINNIGGYTGAYLNTLNACVPILDGCRYDEDATSRFEASNLILLKIWKYVEPRIEENRERMKQEKKALEDLIKELEKNGPQGNSAPVKSGRFFAPDPNAEREEQGEIQKVVDYETGRIALIKTEGFDDGDTGGVVQNNFYTGAGYESSGDDIERLLSTMAEQEVYHALEQQLSEELQDEAGRINYGNAHKGIQVIVNRMVDVPDQLAKDYARVSPPLLLLSKRLQKQVAQILKDRRGGGKLGGLFMGRRVEARAFAHQDGRLFYNKRLPQEQGDMAVALLCDESGSMSSCDRITTARAASIVMHDFCRSLGIPVLILGHTVNEEVELFSYADFDSMDGKDAYRLMDMSARGCNRDGAALRYTAERLLKRPEKNKILILISDGQPYDGSYCGTAAEADLRGIRKEYANKGITLFAAAIGDDKPNIERIYQSGFLDITDLNKLPLNLTSLLTRYIK